LDLSLCKNISTPLVNLIVQIIRKNNRFKKLNLNACFIKELDLRLIIDLFKD